MLQKKQCLSKQLKIAGCIFIMLMSGQKVFSQRAFSLRTPALNIKGDVLIIGNRLMSGSSSTNNNDGTTMSNIDMDGVVTTGINSSSADLSLPVGAAVSWAGLYWAARSLNANRDKIKFKKLGAGYTTYTASQLDNGNTVPDLVGENHYQGFVDVTTYVQTNGSGTYWGGDVQATGGNDGTGFYAGWALVVAYQDDTQPYRNITVFDGYDAVYSHNLTVNISGFLTPSSGGFTTKLGVVAWEGDLYNTGDRMRLNANIAANNITNGSNPSTNFFNSTISSASARNPSTVNNWGVDFDYITSNIALPTNANNTNVYFGTSGDLYMPGVLVFTTDINPVMLPVELISFDAVRTDADVQLDWATASERNNEYFAVERSADAVKWDSIGNVEGNGTSSGYHQYDFTDTRTLDFLAETRSITQLIYYRLKQVDVNGTTAYSDVESVKFPEPKFDFTLYPNPAKGNSVLSLPYFKNFMCDVKLMNSKGDKVFETTLQEGASKDIELKNLHSGLYFMEIKNDNKIIRKRLLVE